jgi:uncharacterized protein Yka (UPF0111/DUF47 family)
MGLQNVIRWLLPREEVFFSLIERQFELLDEAAKALAQLADGVPADKVYERVQDLEHQADAIVYEVEERFAQVFVTPIDREDLQALAVSIDDIVDLIHLTSRTFVLYRVPKATQPMIELMHLLVSMAGVLRSEIPALRQHEYAKLIAAGRVIKTHEKQGDQIFRTAVGELFHNPDIDAKVLLRDKEVLEDLENAIDAFETVAERLKNLAVKHG